MDDSTELKDKAAVAAVREGNTAAFRELTERYGNMIYTLAYRHTMNTADAEDIAQDVFLAVYRGLKSYDQTKKFFSWMYAVALNVIRKHLSRRRISSLFTPLDDSVSVEEKPDSHDDLLKKINAVLNRQRPLFKQVFVLHYYEEQTVTDIAALLGISEANVKVILHRVREKIKHAFPEGVEL